MLEEMKFLNKDEISEIQKEYLEKNPGPVYVYSEKILNQKAEECLNFPNAFWLTVRYAMKTNPIAAILQLFDQKWIHIDASSSFEVQRAIKTANISPSKIQLTTQEHRYNLAKLMNLWIQYNATSLHQLKEYAKKFPNTSLSVRINPGVWSWFTKKTSTGWITSSFGIWHGYIQDVKKIAQESNLNIDKIHIHIWSGSDPKVWENVALIWLQIVEQFPDVHTLNLWGWFKVARMNYEKATNLQETWESIKKEFEKFYDKTGRKIHLEIEPWSYLVANAWAIVWTVEDIVDTWDKGHTFIKSDIGMPDILRPWLYGSQHPIIIVTDNPNTKKYVVVWPCCESGDVLTVNPDNPNEILPRKLNEAQIWDTLVLEWAWAYCSSLSAKNYNSYPSGAEIMLKEDGKLETIKKAEKMKNMRQNEVLMVLMLWKINLLKKIIPIFHKK